MTRVVVMGVAGSGKSTVGRRVAHLLQWPLIDADDLHSTDDRAAMAAGAALTDDQRHAWIERVRSAMEQHVDVVVACSALRRAITQQYRRDEQKMAELLGGREGDIELREGDVLEDNVDLSDAGSGDEDSKIVRAVNMILYQAASDRVSDIHIEPFEKRTRVRFRKDGVLSEVHSLGKTSHNAIISRLTLGANVFAATFAAGPDATAPPFAFQVAVPPSRICTASWP